MRLRTTHVTLACLFLLETLCLGGTKLADIPRLVEESARPGSRITEAGEEAATSIQQLGPDAIPYLLPLLRHERWDIRRLTAHILSGIDGLRDEHLDALMESRLKGDEWVLPAIARVGTPRAIRFLVDELKVEARSRATRPPSPFSRDTELTSVFTSQLGEKGVPYLVELIKSGAVDGWLFTTVVSIFNQLGEKAESAIDPLIEFAADGKGDTTARGWAVLVLGAIDKKAHRSMRTLLALESDEPENFAIAVNSALQDMGVPEAIPGLVKRLTEKPDPYVFSAIARLGDSGKAAGPAIVPYLSSDDWDIRIKAARAIGRIGYQEGIPHLVKLLKTEDDWRLVYVSAESLGRLRATEAMQALIDVSKGHWYRHVRLAAERAVLVIQGQITYAPQDQEARAMLLPSDFVGIEAFDEALCEPNLWENHPPYVGQSDHLDREQLKKLAYKAQIGYLDPNAAGGILKPSFKAVEQVPEVGIQVTGGYLLGSDRGEWGGELVFIDSAGKQTTLLSENVHEICTMPFGIVVVTGLSHLGIDGGDLFKVWKDDNGVWRTSRWRVLPDAPSTVGMLANGNLYVGCYRGSVEILASGDLKAAER